MTTEFFVIIPAFNAEEFIAQALNSLLSQEYPYWSCVVVVDGATDSTFRIADSFATQDNRITVLFQANRGTGGAINSGLKLIPSASHWVCILSADDYYLPKKFDVLARFAEQNTQALFLHHGFYTKDMGSTSQNLVTYNSLGRQPRKNLEFIDLLQVNYINGICTALHGSLVMRTGLYRADLRYAQDYDFFLRCSTLHAPVFIPHELAVSRFHPGQGSAEVNAINKGLADCILAISRCLIYSDLSRVIWDASDPEIAALRFRMFIRLITFPPTIQVIVLRKTFAFAIARLLLCLSRVDQEILLEILNSENIKVFKGLDLLQGISFGFDFLWSINDPIENPVDAANAACRTFSATP